MIGPPEPENLLAFADSIDQYPRGLIAGKRVPK